MISDHAKHDIEDIAYDIKELVRILGMSDDQILAHSNESSPSKIKSLLLEIADAILLKVRFLVWLCSSSHMTNITSK